MTLDANAIASAIYAAGGGDNSQLQDPKQVYLGHPAFPHLDPRLAPDVREYAGQCWAHEGSGAFGAPDDDTTARDDMQPAVFTVFLPAGAIPEGHIRYDMPVKVRNVSGRLTVIGPADIEAREFVEGVPEHTLSAIGPELMAFGLLRPTNPPSAAVELVGGIYQVGEDTYAPPTKVSAALISTYTASLVGNQAVAVQVRFDPDAETFDFTAGTAFNDDWRSEGVNDHLGAFAAGHYPASNASSSLFIKGWIKFRRSMTEITQADILPNPGSSAAGTGGGLSEEDLPDVAFANKFTAKFNAGVTASLPANAGGVGDIFFATDTNVLYICESGTAWTGYGIGDSAVTGKLYLLLAGGTMTGDILMEQNKVGFRELGSHPSNPSSTRWYLYAYDGNVYLRDSAGNTFDLTAVVAANTLAGLTDVDSAAQTAGFVLATDGGNYYGRALVIGDIPTITVAKGGTNITSYTAGDMLYATGATTLAKVGIGTTGQVLKVNGSTLPEWQDESGGGGGGSANDGGSVSVTGGGFVHSSDLSSTNMIFDTTDYDTGDYVDLGTNNDRITIPTGEGGTFLVTFHVRAFISDGVPSVFSIRADLYKNEVTFLMRATAHDPLESALDEQLSCGGSHRFALSAEDYLTIQITQDTGGNDEVSWDGYLSVSKMS